MTTTTKGAYGIKKECVNTKENNSEEQISQILHNLISETKKDYNQIVLFCIGTDRSTGDSLAPMLGTYLTEGGQLDGKCRIYGTLQNPVHALNLENVLSTIDIKNSLVIAIDASLGSKEQIEKVYMSIGTIRPGKAFEKNLPCVGDISIAGVVNFEQDGFLGLQSTRLGLVHDMVKKIEWGIVGAINKFNIIDSNKETIKNRIVI